MQKQQKLNRWFWKWHVIAGLFTLPVMLFLSITGTIYLFKAYYNDAAYKDIHFFEILEQHKEPLSYQTQLAAAQATTQLHVSEVIIPEDNKRTTMFRLHGKKGDHTRNLVHVHPYEGTVSGQVVQRDTLMYKIRKLHGELLLNKAGTYTVELVASWFIVLIITGLYVWWPSKRFKNAGLKGFFTVRINKGKRLLFRDLHVVGGFWLSLFMAIILAGGMPWTDLFGSELKWVQKQTNTGYPKNWTHSSGLQSLGLKKSDLQTFVDTQALNIDQMVNIAQAQNLSGQITIKLPMNKQQVFSVSNRSLWLRDQQVLHFDQYSGDIVQAYTWQDVGILMELRQIAMRLHQGEYGFANWLAVLIIVVIFTVTTAAGLISYLMRKPQGRWGIPKVPEDFKVGYGLSSIMVLMAIILPAFGISLLLIIIIEALRNNKGMKNAFSKSQVAE